MAAARIIAARIFVLGSELDPALARIKAARVMVLGRRIGRRIIGITD